MSEPNRNQLTPGTLVEVTQQIPRRDRTWSNTVRGVILSYQQKQTGSWFAHSRNDRLWLDRLMLRKDDGEVTTLNLDDYSHVKVLSRPEEGAEKPATATGEMTTK